MENTSTLAINWNHIDYIGELFEPCIGNTQDDLTERYVIHFQGGNVLILLNQKPINGYHNLSYCNRDDFIDKWRIACEIPRHYEIQIINFSDND